MHTGMLWFDNSQSPLDVKISKAAKYYEEKYGRKPDLVLVHPSMIQEQNQKLLQLMPQAVRSYRPVLPGHIWIGIEDKE